MLYSMSKQKLGFMSLLLILSTFIVPMATPVALAQSSKGILTGTVTDPSGAVVSGATIRMTNTATGVTRETVSTGDGSYRLDAVEPGNYTVEVVAGGFKTVTLNNVPIAAGQASTSDFKLEIGAQGEVISVTADNTVILQQQDGARTNTLDQRQIVELPVAGLNPTNLVFTLPGVVSPGQASGFVQGLEFSINGLRPRANSNLLDGTENNDISIHGQAYQPTLRDGYQEVSVLGGDNSAEYGRGGGAVVNVISRGGTNQFHGSLYDVIFTSALASLTSGQKANEGLTSVPVLTENQFCGSFGGRVIKDKLFFFGTYQEDRTRAGGVTATGVVPTEAGFNQLRALFPAGTSPNLDLYLNAIGNLRGSLNPISVPLGGGRPDIPFATVSVPGTQPINDHQFLTRWDFTPDVNNTFTARYVYDNSIFANQFPTIFPGFEVDVPGKSHNAYLSWTRSLSPTWTNEFRFSYGRFQALFTPRNQSAIDFGPQIGISGTQVTTIGLSSLFPQGRILNNFQYQDTITHIMGAHSIRAGVDLTRQLTKEFIPFNNRGSLAFTTGGGFPAFGNFVDAFSGTQGVFATKFFGNPVVYPNRFQQAYFVSDSWKVKPNFTLNLGLRYENYGTPANVLLFPAFSGFDAPLNARVEQKSDNNNFAPRVSFAYTPRMGTSGLLGRFFGEDRTVIRGGYGISYDAFFDNILLNTAATSPNVFGVTTTGVTAGGRGFVNAVPTLLPTTGSPNPLATVNSISPDLVNPLTHVWNLGIQRELIGNMILDVAYVGSRGERLFINEQYNPGVNGVRIFPGRGSVLVRTNGGDSNYHSLQTRLERGFRNGLFLRATYTYSKTIDNTNSEVFTTAAGANIGSNPFDRRVDRSVADFDVPHRGTLAFVYDFPTPRTDSRIVRGLLGGYTLSGNYRIQSGAVATPYVFGADLNGDLSATNDRPSLGNPNAPAHVVAFASSFAPCAAAFCDVNGNPIDPNNARFIVDPDNRTNLAGRNILRAPKINSLDLSMQRRIKFYESHALEIRVEFFNVFNHPQFTWDNTLSDSDVTNPFFNRPDLNDGGIGYPTNGQTFGRYGRIQLRYSF
jgi:outer membrane receptor protein involved in Fe transport